MTSVSISELKAHLSRYMREVRRGGEVQVLDRGVPVARLSPIGPQAGSSDRRARLVRAGILRSGQGKVSQAVAEKPIDVPKSVLEALEEDRADRL